MKNNDWWDSKWCKNCGREFVINIRQKSRVYCCGECRDEYNKKQRKKKLQKPKPRRVKKKKQKPNKDQFNAIVKLASETGLHYGDLKAW